MKLGVTRLKMSFLTGRSEGGIFNAIIELQI